MVTSDSIKSISTALVGFHKEVGKIDKDAKNPFFKSKYASLSNILEGIALPLANNGLCIVQFPEGDTGLTTRIVHISGEWMEATYNMKSVKDTPQDRGSAITYQRRYAVGAILSLNIDDDDDANAASGKSQPQRQEQEPQKDDKPWLNDNSEAFNNVLKAIKGGGYTVKDVEKKYKLSKEMRGLLEASIPAAKNN
jgi:hypothetical protein